MATNRQFLRLFQTGTFNVESAKTVSLPSRLTWADEVELEARNLVFFYSKMVAPMVTDHGNGLAASPGVLTRRSLMTVHASKIGHKNVAFRKNMFLLVYSSLSHSRNDEELPLFPQVIDSAVYNVYLSSSRILYAPIGCSHCD